MLDYIKCPTCSRIISYDLDKYRGELKNLREDPNKTKKQKEDSVGKLLDKYGFKMICCRGRIMGSIPYHEIIVS